MERGKRKRKLAELKQRVKTWSTINDDGDEFNDCGEDKVDKEEEMIDATTTREWSSLIEPLLLSILSRLTTLEDFFSFRGVCAHWRSICAPVPSPACVCSQPPLLLLAISGSSAQPLYDISCKRSYRIPAPWDAESRYALGYAHGYVITTSRGARPRPLLWNLFTGEIVRFTRALLQFQRVILTTNPANSDCLLVLIDIVQSTLQYCHPGGRQWSVQSLSEPGLTLDIRDVIYFKGKLYVLTNAGQLGLIDLIARPSMTLFQDKIMGRTCKKPCGTPWWLSEARGEILMVCYHGQPNEVGSLRFELWCWDFTRSGWVEMPSLHGWTLFLGSNGFAASVPPTGYGVRQNCIYCSGFSCDNWTVYCLDDGSYRAEFVPVACLGVYLIPMPAVWVFPSMCC